jgi:hypothetical protein
MVNKETLDRTRKSFGDISKMSERVLGKISVAGGTGSNIGSVSGTGLESVIGKPKISKDMFGSKKDAPKFEREGETDIEKRLEKLEIDISNIKKCLREASTE